MNSRFKTIKNLFIDSVEINNFVELDVTKRLYERLEESLDKPLKMVLLFGKPGTGKSMMLNKLVINLKNKREIHYFEAPILTEKEFLKSIYEAISSKSVPANLRVNFDGLLKYVQSLKGKREIVFLLDECQLYSEALMEKIRLLSDTRVIKFVITLHKTEDEDLIAKEHFKTRIWDVIELENANFDELHLYIQKKLMGEGFIEVSNMFTQKVVKLIHKYTNGNFRETNKFLYTLFEIYEFYEINEPHRVSLDKMSKKIFEMSALKLGYLK
ncbi:MAG: ATP-binding protein [Epsilonproteobacteria bacterium]|nr:ATP-binding protein [Campylobacterota bacterium]